MRRRAVISVAVAAITIIAAPVVHAALRPAPRSAVERAQAWIRTKTDTRLARNQTFSFRSSRDRRWALVDGLLADERLWAVWLRHNGWRWVVKSGGIGRARARARGVPCDIVVAFSEPAC
jgi:hypothetical protein